MVNGNEIERIISEAKKKVEFGEDGIVFYFPNSRKHIFVCDLGEPDTRLPKEYTFKFNFDLGNCLDPDFKFAEGSRLEEPFVLEVKYSNEDITRVGGNLEKLNLSIKYDNWVLKTAQAYKTQFKERGWIGSFKLLIQEWDDPEVAWGP